MKSAHQRSTCQRVQALLDQALEEGALTLPPDLAAHVAHCSRCGPEYTGTADLLARLRRAAAAVDLARLPEVVDRIMAHTVAEPAIYTAAGSPNRQEPGKRATPIWVLGQIAAVAAVLLLLTGGVAFSLLKVNQAVSGARPDQVVDRLMAPFRSWTWAEFSRSIRELTELRH